VRPAGFCQIACRLRTLPEKIGDAELGRDVDSLSHATAIDHLYEGCPYR
jgi:hypothetical protein